MEYKTTIFAGKVTAAQQPRQKMIMSSTDAVKVTSCGYENFVVGTSYIVSAYGEADQQETGLCEMTMPLAGASAQLAALEEGYEPSAQSPGSIASRNDNFTLSLIVTIAALVIGGVMIIAKR